jgi:hypothetical protein
MCVLGLGHQFCSVELLICLGRSCKRFGCVDLELSVIIFKSRSCGCYILVEIACLNLDNWGDCFAIGQEAEPSMVASP